MPIDRKGLDTAITGALHETIDYAARLIQENLVAVRYPWPRVTRRANGEIVYSPRDAIDTKELYLSQYRVKGKNSGAIGYSADHALPVHEGEENKPDRPWVTLTAEENGEDIKRNFADNLRKRIN